MNTIFKNFLQKFFNVLGYKISKNDDKMEYKIPVEFNEIDIKILTYVLQRKLTMVSVERLVATIQACKYVIENSIEGDFVECGVWKGGNSIAAKMVFEAYGCDKEVYLFDTFSGMTEPTEYDTSDINELPTMDEFINKKREGYNEWCYTSLDEVKSNFARSKVDLSGVKFTKGDVLKTLDNPENQPQNISVLRLDTDWYESTRKEMEKLYPILSEGGVLLVDDYGYWDGARKAIEEYFLESNFERPFLHYTDQTGRTGVKR